MLEGNQFKGRKIVFQCVVSETSFITRQVGPVALCFVHVRWNRMAMGTLAGQACSFHGRGEGEDHTLQRQVSEHGERGGSEGEGGDKRG